jgi:hypothetical protein
MNQAQDVTDASAPDSADEQAMQSLKTRVAASDQAAEELASGTVRCPTAVALPAATRAECIRIWWSSRESLAVSFSETGAAVDVACARAGELRRIVCTNVGTLNYVVGTLRPPVN